MSKVFKDIGFDDAESQILEMKSTLLNQILQIVEQEGYSQKDLQEILSVPQPRVSELLNGKMSTMGMEKLIVYLVKLGCAPTWNFKCKKA